MIDVPGDGFPLRLLVISSCKGSGISIGHCLKQICAWDKKGRLLQVLLVLGRRNRAPILTDAADGRATIIVAETVEEDERLVPTHVRAVDVQTGVVRWRRTEKLHDRAACFVHRKTGRVVVRLAAPHGAHLFDVDTGERLRAADSELTPRNATQRTKAPSSFVAPAVDLFPRYTLRRAVPGREDPSVQAARHAFFFGPNAARRPQWTRQGTPTAIVWQLVQELRALEGKASISKIPPHLTALDLPPDVQAIFAADSAFLKSHWRIDLNLLPALAKEAQDRAVPKPVVAFGGEAYPEVPNRPRLLCAQATDLDDRLGTFDGLGYSGPFPITTFLSDACWNILEGRNPSENDANCTQMLPIIQRVLSSGG
jgi:hypothetical protein